MSMDDTKLTVRIVSGQKTTITSSKKNVAEPTFTPIATSDTPTDTPPSSTTTTKENNTLSVVTTTDEVEKKDTRNDKENKRFPTSYLYVSFILIAFIIILAGALGGTLGKTTASSDTNTVVTVSTPSQATIITVMVDPTVCDTPPCMEFNLTLITLVRCRLINTMNTNNVSLASWMESNGTVITIKADHPLNQGDCSTVSTFRRRQLQAVFGEEPVNPVAANFSVTVPPTTTTPSSLTTQACSTNVRLRIKGCTSGTTVIPATPSSTVTPSTSPSVSLTSTSTTTYIPPGVSPSNSPSTSYLPSSPSPSNAPFNYWYNGKRGNYGINNKVNAFFVYNNQLYLGGSFDKLGDGKTIANYIVAWDSSTSTWATLPNGTSNGVSSAVNAFAVYNNLLYIGGSFTKLGDGITSANRIVAWDGNTWYTLPCGGNSNGLGGEVTALAVYNNLLYIGGSFTNLGDGSTSASRIVAWDGNAFVKLSVGGNSNGFDNQVNVFGVYNNLLYIGGQFTRLSNGITSASRIVAWNGTTLSNLPSGNNNNGVNGPVLAFCEYNNRLYIGGEFNKLSDGTTVANAIVAWNGTTWSTLDIVNGTSNGVNSGVRSLAVYNNQLYIGGLFTKLGDGSTWVNYIVAWDGSFFSKLLTSTNYGVYGFVLALAVYDNQLYLGGSISGLDNFKTLTKNVAAWNGTLFSVPEQVTPRLLGLAGSVNAIVSYKNKMYVGGEFTQTMDGTVSVRYIAAYDPGTLTFSNLPQSSSSSNGVSNTVFALVVYNNLLYIGGSFDKLGDDISAKRIVAWNGTTWSTLGGSGTNNGVSSTVNALAVYNNLLFIGGAFTTLGDGTTAYNVITYDGTTLSNLANAGITGKNGNVVRAFAVYKNQLFIGGKFSHVADYTIIANNIVAYDGNTFTRLSYGTSNGVAGGTVNDLTVCNDKLYIGGTFTTLGDGTFANGIVSWDGTSYTNVTASTGSTINGTVNGFGVIQSTLYIGGSFTSLRDGTFVNRVIGYDGASWTNVAIGTTTGIADGEVKRLYADGNTLYIGGSFKQLGDGTEVNNLAWTVQSLTYSFPSGTPSNTPTPSYTSSVTHTVSTTSSITPSSSPSPSNSLSNYWYTGSRGNYGVGGYVNALIVYNNLLYTGGSFSTFGDYSTSCNNIVAWDSSTSTWETLPNGTSNGVSSAVNAFAVYNNLLYIGGSFTNLGDGSTSANYIVAWDGNTWYTLPCGGNSNGLAGNVNALVVYNNLLYIGGQFIRLRDDTIVNRIVAWNGTTFFPLPTGSNFNGLADAVTSFAVYSNKLYIGGLFMERTNGVSSKYIAAWDGSMWTTLSVGSNSNGVDSRVYALSVYDNQLYIGGWFSNLGDGKTPAKYVVAWNGTTWISLLNGTLNGLNNKVFGFAVYNNQLYIGGQFDKLGDGVTSAKRIVTYDSTTSAWTPLSSGGTFDGVNNDINTLAVYNDQLYIGGKFTKLGDGVTAAKNIATWNSSSSFSVPVQATPPLIGLLASVKVMVKYNNQVYVSGDFIETMDGLRSIQYLATYDPVTMTFNNLPMGNSNGVNNQVFALSVYNNLLYVGGAFTKLNDGTPVNCILAWNGSTWSKLINGTDSAVDGFGSSVYAFAVYNNLLYIGGSFTKLGGGTATLNRIVTWDGSIFNSLPSGTSNGVNGLVNALTVYNNQLYIGGAFDKLGDGTLVNRIVVWDGNVFTKLSGLFSTGFSGAVNLMTVYNNKLYIGGSFLSLSDGTYVNGLVGWDGNEYFFVRSTSGVKLITGTSSNTVNLLYTGNGKLYIGGSFTRLSDGSTVNRIVGYDGTSWTNVTIGNATGFADGAVYSLYADGNILYFGGSFRKLDDGTLVNYLVWSNV